MKRLFIMLFLIVYAATAQGATYTIGSDPSDNYTTFALFRAAHTETTGDIVSFRRGDIFTFTSTPITVPTNGVTYTAHGTGNKPILDGDNNTLLAGIIVMTSKSNIVIQNLRVRGGDEIGIKITTSTDISLSDMEIDNNIDANNAMGHGVFIDSSSNNVSVLNCYIHGNDCDGVWIDGSTNVLISGNTFVNNGISSYSTGDGDAIGFWNSSGIVINNNSIDNSTGYGAAIYGASNNSALVEAKIYNNTIVQTNARMSWPRIVSLSNGTYKFYFNAVTGFTKSVSEKVVGVLAEDNGYGACHWVIVNNAITGCDSSIVVSAATIDASSSLLLKNNISYNPLYRHLTLVTDSAILSKTISDSNVFYPDKANCYYYISDISSLAAWQSTSSMDASSLNTDPLFISALNFRLQPASPVIRSGVFVPGVHDQLGCKDMAGRDCNSMAIPIGAYSVEYPTLRGTE